MWSIQNSVKYEKSCIKLEIIADEKWVKQWQQGLLAGDPKSQRETAAVCAGTKRFCGCCNLADITHGEEAWEIAQKELTDFDF